MGCCVGFLGPHPLPPWRVTSPMSKSASTPPAGPFHWPKGDLSGSAIPSLLVVSSWISSNTFLSWTSLRSLMAMWSCGQDSWGLLGDHFPTWDLHLSTRGISAPQGHILPYLCTCRWVDTDLNGFIVPSHGCSEKMHHSQHLRARLECEDCFGIWKL